jgi:ubiquinone/menaquinone biosynthesis C-methylase UbiE/uncharacterized protein YbaR (Trm112 family)
MIEGRLSNVLKCISCNSNQLNFLKDKVICLKCNAEYPINNNIPSMMIGGVDAQDWNPWSLDELKMTGDSYYKRAKGELPEKEASISFANLLAKKDLYEKNATYLDIGCATGHFLKSFRNKLDKKIQYTGIDISSEYLQWGGEIFGHSKYCNFVHCDSLNMPFIDKSFDYTIVNLFHFFPNLEDALKETIRVTNKMIIWRTPIGEITYMIKWVLNEQSFDKLGSLHIERKDIDHCIYMLYSKVYIESIVASLGGRVKFIERDIDFKDFDNTSIDSFKNIPSTKASNGVQMNGNLHLDWHYVGIEM